LAEQAEHVADPTAVVVVPFGQVVHDVAPAAAENVFMGHWVQLALFCVAENEPAAHCVHACVAVTDEPASHVLAVGAQARPSPAPDVSDVLLHRHVVGALTLAPAVEFV